MQGARIPSRACTQEPATPHLAPGPCRQPYRLGQTHRRVQGSVYPVACGARAWRPLSWGSGACTTWTAAEADLRALTACCSVTCRIGYLQMTGRVDGSSCDASCGRPVCVGSQNSSSCCYASSGGSGVWLRRICQMRLARSCQVRTSVTPARLHHTACPPRPHGHTACCSRPDSSPFLPHRL
jgi:hypothetical protein